MSQGKFLTRGDSPRPTTTNARIIAAVTSPHKYQSKGLSIFGPGFFTTRTFLFRVGGFNLEPSTFDRHSGVRSQIKGTKAWISSRSIAPMQAPIIFQPVP